MRHRERLGLHRLQSKTDLWFLRDSLLWYTANLPAAVPGSSLFTHQQIWVSRRLILEGMHSCIVSCLRYYVVLQENGITEQVQTYCRMDPAILKQHGDVDKNQNSPLGLLQIREKMTVKIQKGSMKYKSTSTKYEAT